jgi:hypothetical protein
MVQLRDNGIIGAFMLYLDDKDINGFKARIIHKVDSERGSSAGLSSVMPQMQHGPGSAVGRRRPMPTERYLPVIMDLEMKSLLDE